MELFSNKNYKKYAATALTLVASSAIAFAQVETTVNGIGDDWTLAMFFAFVLNLILGVGFSLTLVMLAMGFIQYIMAQGDKLGVEKAQKWVTYSVIGGLGLFLVFAIRSAIQRVVPGGGTDFVGKDVTI